MKVSTAFPSKYLKAADIPTGSEVQVNIDSVRLEELEQSGDEKPVLYFVGKTKGLVLNKTNASTLSAAYGDEADNWYGQPVVIFSDTTDFQGRRVPCLRVRVPAPAIQTANLATDNGGDEIPF